MKKIIISLLLLAAMLLTGCEDVNTSSELEWTESNLTITMYVNEAGIYSRSKAILDAPTVKQYDINDAVEVVAKTNTAYYKLTDGSYIHADYLSKDMVESISSQVETSIENSTITSQYVDIPKGENIEEIQSVAEAFTKAVINKDFDTIRSMLDIPVDIQKDDIFISDKSIMGVKTLREESKCGNVSFENYNVVINNFSDSFDPAYSSLLIVDAEIDNSYGFSFFLTKVGNEWKVANAQEQWYLTDVSLVIPSGFEKVTYNDKVIDDKFITEEHAGGFGLQKKYTLPIASLGEAKDDAPELNENRIGLYLNKDDKEPLCTICTVGIASHQTFEYTNMINNESIDAMTASALADKLDNYIEEIFLGLADAYNTNDIEKAKLYISPDAPSDLIDRIWKKFDEIISTGQGQESIVPRADSFLETEEMILGNYGKGKIYSLTPTVYYLPNYENLEFQKLSKSGNQYFDEEKATMALEGNSYNILDCDYFTLRDISFENS